MPKTQRKTMSFDEFEEEVSQIEGHDIDGNSLVKHLRQQDLRLTAWEENLKKLNQRFTSLDEEFFAHVEKGEEKPTEWFQPNPVQHTPEYQEAQGFAPPIGTANPRSSPNHFDHSQMDITDVEFIDPKQQAAFKGALKALQFIEPSVTEGELVKFLMG